MIFPNSQKGQMLLMVILVMVVAMTVGLSIASRSVTNIKISKQNDESQKAFQAAEAGINVGAKQNIIQNPSLKTLKGTFSDNNAHFDTQIEEAKDNTLILNGGREIDQDVGYDLWLADSSPPYQNWYVGDLDIFYSDNNQTNCSTGSLNNSRPAIETLILLQESGNYYLNKYVYDNCGRFMGSSGIPTGIPDGTASHDILDTVTGTTITFKYRIRIFNSAFNPSPTRHPILMRIVPFYNSTKIAVKTVAGATNLPTQGKVITSSGTAGDTERKLTYFESLPQIPSELFQYAILSQ